MCSQLACLVAVQASELPTHHAVLSTGSYFGQPEEASIWEILGDFGMCGMQCLGEHPHVTAYAAGRRG